MRLSPIISVWLPLSAGITAQILDLPAVDELVSSVMHNFAAYTKLATPHATASPAAATGKPSARSFGEAPYWLESIPHQGKAPFSSHPSTYKIFRNVKDYGAKGMLLFLRMNADTNIFRGWRNR